MRVIVFRTHRLQKIFYNAKVGDVALSNVKVVLEKGSNPL